jgi:hypothetical protein
MQAKSETLEPIVLPATVNIHEHKFFIQQSLLGEIPIDIMVCGRCGYSTTRVYVDHS